MSSYAELLETLELTEEDALQLLLTDLREELHDTQRELRRERLVLLKNKMLLEIVGNLTPVERANAAWSETVGSLEAKQSRRVARIDRIEQRLQELRQD